MEDGKANPDIWAIGDAVRLEEGPLPATAQGKRCLGILCVRCRPN